MKTTSILFQPFHGPINPLKLKLDLILPVKKITQEIGIVRLLEVILLTSALIGLVVFLGMKIL